MKSRLAPNAGNLAGPLFQRSSDAHQRALRERRNRAVLRGVSNLHPLFIAKAKRALLTDVEGRECIVFAGGIGVNNVGHQHPKVLAALREHLETYLQPCFHVM